MAEVAARTPAKARTLAPRSLEARNRRLMLVCVGVVTLMIGGAFASAPFYRFFCQATGFGGATLKAEKAPNATVERTVIVRFNADTDPGLPWEFRPAQREVRMKLGEEMLAHYTAINRSRQTVTGNAVFNVTPDKAGAYFNKIECFCFKEQTLEPGREADLPVTFFVDPALAQDVNMEDVKVITLSYTFYRAKDQPPARTSAVAPAQAKPVN